MFKMILIITLLIALTGCSPSLVMYPDSPMLVESVHWNGVEVSVYDKATNSLVHYGRVPVPPGFTLSKYNWEDYISKRRTD